MNIKKIGALLMAVAMAASLTACNSSGKPASGSSDKPYIAIVSKGFQHQFWQVVKKGAEAAAADLGVEITFEGPQSESDINDQVNMLKSAINRQPDAIALAALDTESVKEQLNECLTKGIPVIGFDSGVPNAPAGSIYATASTNNYEAAGIAAQKLFENADFQAKLKAGKITVGVLSQDATSESVTQRTRGFIETLTKLVEAENAGSVEVVGHDLFKKAATADVKLTIKVNIPATTSAADMKTGAESLLTSENLVAIFGSNEAAANGILAAANDGSEFSDTGRYKDIIAMGFDAGKTQRTAVENGWFYGSITQDPYQIGYKAVSLAVDAINGKAAASPTIDTGAKWYNAEALKDESISQLVYE